MNTFSRLFLLAGACLTLFSCNRGDLMQFLESDSGSSSSGSSAPIWSAGFPMVSGMTRTRAQISMMLESNGTVYYAFLPASSATPTTAQLQSQSVPDAISQGNPSLTAAQPASRTCSSLEAGKNYYFYAVAEDSISGTLGGLVRASFTTPTVAQPYLVILAHGTLPLGTGSGSYAFGTVGHTSSHSITLTISNGGEADLNISSITGIEGDTSAFTCSGGAPVTIATGDSWDTQVTFQPGGLTGNLWAKYQIDSNDPDQTSYVLELRGESVAGASQVAQPTFNYSGGLHRQPISLTINCSTSGALIRYTTNGTTPSDTYGIQYSGPITLGWETESLVVKAIAYSSGMLDSPVAEATYTIRYWDQLGNAVGTASSAAEVLDICTGPAGQPVVAFRDTSNGDRLTVMQWDGATWTSMGSPGITPSPVSHVRIAYGDGQYYVAYSDHGQSQRAVVRHWASGWIQVGPAPVSLDAVNSLALAISNGGPVVAYRETTGTQGGNCCCFNGSSWVPFGAYNFNGALAGPLALTVAQSPVNGPLVAFADAAYGHHTTLWHYTGFWTNRTSVQSFGQSGSVSLCTNNGNVYMAYQDQSVGNKITVKEMSPGQIWSGLGLDGFSLHPVNAVQICRDGSGSLVTGFLAVDGDQRPTVRWWNSGGGSWDVLGNPRFGGNNCDAFAMASSGSGIFVVVRNSSDGKIIVYRNP